MEAGLDDEMVVNQIPKYEKISKIGEGESRILK